MIRRYALAVMAAVLVLCANTVQAADVSTWQQFYDEVSAGTTDIVMTANIQVTGALPNLTAGFDVSGAFKLIGGTGTFMTVPAGVTVSFTNVELELKAGNIAVNGGGLSITGGAGVTALGANAINVSNNGAISISGAVKFDAAASSVTVENSNATIENTPITAAAGAIVFTPANTNTVSITGSTIAANGAAAITFGGSGAHSLVNVPSITAAAPGAIVINTTGAAGRFSSTSTGTIAINGTADANDLGALNIMSGIVNIASPTLVGKAITSAADVTLTNVVINAQGSSGTSAPMTSIESSGTLRVNGAAITGNYGTSDTPTIKVIGGTAMMNTGTIRISGNAGTVLGISGGSKVDLATGSALNNQNFYSNSGTRTVSVSENSTLNLFGSFVSANSAEPIVFVESGALNVDTTGSEITTFSANSATAIILGTTPNDQVVADFRRTVFQNAPETPQAPESVIVSRGTTLFGSGVKFNSNTAKNQIVYANGGRVTFAGATVSNNKLTAGTDAKGIIFADKGAKVSVTDGTVVGGNSDAEGNKRRALVLAESGTEATLNNATFKYNKPYGAVEVQQDARLVLQNAVMDNNGAASDAQGGGAIKVLQGGILDISSTGTKTFSGNSAPKGGAIYYVGDFSIPANRDVTFSYNTADDSGGAVYQANGEDALGNAVQGSVSLSAGTTFRNNVAKKSGGALYSESTKSSAVSVNGAVFTENRTDAVNDGKGGAIFASGQMSVQNGTFTGNYTTSSGKSGNGGAIYVNATEVDRNTVSVLTISGGTFLNNRSDNGGAVYALMAGGDGGRVTVTGGTFGGKGQEDPNIALNGDGGAIWCGGIYSGSNPTGTVVFISNNAKRYGGAIYTGETVRGEVRRMTFDGNSAESGGAVYAADKLTVDNSIFKENFADVSNGGAIYLNNESVVANSSFVGNYAPETIGAGGAIYLPTTADQVMVVVKNSYFSGNHASTGGAIWDEGTGPALAVYQSYFTNNFSTGGGQGGGAIHVRGSYFIMMQSTMVGNHAEGDTPDSSGVDSSGGGAISCLASSYRIVNSTFYDNSVDGAGYGGAVSLWSSAGSGDSNSAILYCTFAKNSEAGLGGALFTAARNLNLGMNIFISNGGAATIGKDVYLLDGQKIVSQGYNIVANYGRGPADTPNADFPWRQDNNLGPKRSIDIPGSSNTMSLIFGSETARPEAHADDLTPYGMSPHMAGATISYEAVTYRNAITTMKLRSNEGTTELNPARVGLPVGDAVFTTFFNTLPAGSPFSMTSTATNPSGLSGYNIHQDARNVRRGVASPAPTGGRSTIDIGAYQSIGSSNPTPGPLDDATIQIGGITNRTMSAGQVITLTATLLMKNGDPIVDPTVLESTTIRWSATPSEIATIDNYGNLTTLRPGEFTISVQVAEKPTVRNTTQTMIVRYPSSYTNIASTIWDEWRSNIVPLSYTNMMIDGDKNPSNVTAIASYFRGVYGVDAQQLSTLGSENGVRLTQGIYKGTSTYGPLRDSLHLSLSTNTGPGALIPMKFSYIFTSSEIDTLLDYVHGAASVASENEVGAELFKDLRIAFTGEDGNTVVVIGSGGTPFSQALNNGFGALSWKKIGEIYRLDLEAYITDAVSTTQQVNFWNRTLVIADNDANGRIDGTLHLLSSTKRGGSGGGGNNGGGGNSGGSGGGGGGGGCAAGAAAIAALAIPLALRRKK